MASQAQRVVIRPPQRLPEHSEGSGDIPSDRNHEIIIKHPGYDDGYNVILMLPALDRSAGGLDHATVLVICGILTGNRWHGCLTRERDGQPVPQDGFLIVPVGEYYFYPAAPSVGELLSPAYAVVPSFSSWRFPHGNLPSLWKDYDPSTQPRPFPSSSSNITATVHTRDHSKCRVSGRSEVCEMAHLCPSTEDVWFHSNEMVRYIYAKGQTGSSAIRDINNLILLRSDIHTSFDRRKFVMVPKQGSASQGMKIVVHMLEHSEELAQLYHNVEVQSVSSIPLTFLFVRLAWAVFPLLEGFLQANVERTLLINGQTKTRVSAQECRGFTKQRGTRSRTNRSKKRQKEDDVGAEGEEHDDCMEGLQARKRKRRSSTVVERNIRRHSNPNLTSTMTGSISPPPSSSRSTQGDNSREPPLLVSHDDASKSTHVPNKALTSAGSCQHRVAPRKSTATHLNPNTNSQLTIQVPSQSLLPSTDWSEDNRLEDIKQQMLRAERDRSDAGGSWLKELEWAEKVPISRPLSPQTLKKYYEVMGVEILSEGEDG